MEAVKISMPDKLVEYIKQQQIKNVLVGNGFCLSHPKLGECFNWNWQTIFNDFSNESLSKCLKASVKTPFCPETFLSDVRLYFVECILKSYIKKLCLAIGVEHDKTVEENYKLSGLYTNYIKLSKNSAANFLSAFTHIFTVNYDPLIYFEKIKLKNKVKVIDGFNGGEFKLQTDIMSKLHKVENKNEKKLYFLHGSWFIQAKKEQKLRKILFNKSSKDSLNDLFNWQEKCLPWLIFEDRPSVKNLLIKESAYFSGCLDKLQHTEGNLLVFGMSFNRDEHILDTLRKSQFKKIYFTYLDDKDKLSIDKKILNKEKDKFNAEISFINVSPNVVWQIA